MTIRLSSAAIAVLIAIAVVTVVGLFAVERSGFRRGARVGYRKGFTNGQLAQPTRTISRPRADRAGGGLR